MAEKKLYFINGIQAEPWTASESSTGRRGGQFYTTFHKSAALTAYQAAIKEALQESHPELDGSYQGELCLDFYIWRSLPVNETTKVKSRKHVADRTNLQKSLEDALQGLLFKNDSQVVDGRTRVMEQAHDTQPMILIAVEYEPEVPWEAEAYARAAVNSEIVIHKPKHVRARADFNVEDVF